MSSEQEAKEFCYAAMTAFLSGDKEAVYGMIPSPFSVETLFVSFGIFMQIIIDFLEIISEREGIEPIEIWRAYLSGLP